MTSITSRSGARNEAIDTVLLQYIVEPGRKDELLDVWDTVTPFFGDDIEALLFRPIPEKLRRQHVESVSDGLGQRNPLEQAHDLDIIFSTLFDEGADTKLSPIHQKALLAVAEVRRE